MIFSLTIDIPEHEAEQWGQAEFLYDRLARVAEKIRNGHHDTGTVYDVNGNAIGYWNTEERTSEQ